jgi:hypothetical protein
MSKFNLGKLVSTRRVADLLADNKQFARDVTIALGKYTNCNWGIICKEDAAMNDDAVKSSNDRIFAKYETSEGAIYIITEWDRSVTTILFPDEY